MLSVSPSKKNAIAAQRSINGFDVADSVHRSTPCGYTIPCYASQVIPAERPIKLLMEILLNGFIMTT
jgi:hypothetical protein